MGERRVALVPSDGAMARVYGGPAPRRCANLSGMTTIVVSGDGRLGDPEQPLLYPDELAALRGDGVFETMLIRDGRARLVEPHLERLADGAAVLALPAPDRPALRAAIGVAERAWAERSGAAEGMLRIVYSRGRESRPDGPPTCYLTVGPVAGRVAAARRSGVSAITLDRGVVADPPPNAPWLLAGIKALAYAANTAALRYAAARGADDALFVASDGTVLEGPRSSVVVQRGAALLTPPRSGPILPGTTQAALFAAAAARGIVAREERLHRDDLPDADGVWLLSSVTLAARVHTLDGRPLPDPPGRHDLPALIDAALDS